MITVGERYRFAYPKEFNSLPAYSAHRDQIVTVIRPLSDEEYDNEGDPMFVILADDGWQGEAWESELKPIEQQG